MFNFDLNELIIKLKLRKSEIEESSGFNFKLLSQASEEYIGSNFLKGCKW